MGGAAQTLYVSNVELFYELLLQIKNMRLLDEYATVKLNAPTTRITFNIYSVCLEQKFNYRYYKKIKLLKNTFFIKKKKCETENVLLQIFGKISVIKS